MIVGNDISGFQTVDWNLYRNNTNFVVIKATEGVGFVDFEFEDNNSQATRLDIPRGYYHFARPDLGNSPQDEANFFLNTVGTLIDGEVLALDYEITFHDPVGWCHAFLDEVYARCGVKPLIYLNQATASGFDWTPVIDSGYGLWIAAYTYDPNKNDFNGGKWQVSAMQQWSNKQQVPGISGMVDADVFFGDVEAFKSYGYKTPAPAIPPDPCLNIKQQLADLQKEFDEYKIAHSGTLTVPLPEKSQNTASTANPAMLSKKPTFSLYIFGIRIF